MFVKVTCKPKMDPASLTRILNPNLITHRCYSKSYTYTTLFFMRTKMCLKIYLHIFRNINITSQHSNVNKTVLTLLSFPSFYTDYFIQQKKSSTFPSNHFRTCQNYPKLLTICFHFTIVYKHALARNSAIVKSILLLGNKIRYRYLGKNTTNFIRKSQRSAILARPLEVNRLGLKRYEHYFDSQKNCYNKKYANIKRNAQLSNRTLYL